jgi:hypothetical protein
LVLGTIAWLAATKHSQDLKVLKQVRHLMPTQKRGVVVAAAKIGQRVGLADIHPCQFHCGTSLLIGR